MKTIKELEAEDTCHEDSYFKAGQIQAYEDVLKLIDELFPKCICPEDEVRKDCPNEWTEQWSDSINEELKARING